MPYELKTSRKLASSVFIRDTKTYVCSSNDKKRRGRAEKCKVGRTDVQPQSVQSVSRLMFRAPVNYSTCNYSISLAQPLHYCLLIILAGGVTPACWRQMVQPKQCISFQCSATPCQRAASAHFKWPSSIFRPTLFAQEYAINSEEISTNGQI